MLTSDERKQIDNFHEAIGDVINQYLKEGMPPEMIRSVLTNHETSDLVGRMHELEKE